MPVSISGTTGYAGPLGALTVGTTAIEANAVTPAKMSRSGTSGQVLTSNGAGADPSYQALPAGGVSSAVAGNGIAVSAATGAVTFSAAAPTFNSVGSYCSGVVRLSTGTGTSGNTYPAGSGTFETVKSYNAQNSGTNNLSGTWRWMGATTAYCSCFSTFLTGVFVRVA